MVLVASYQFSGDFLVTAAIPGTRFGGKVLAHSANSIVLSKGTLDDGILFNSDAKKFNRSCRNGVNTATSFLEYIINYIYNDKQIAKPHT